MSVKPYTFLLIVLSLIVLAACSPEPATPEMIRTSLPNVTVLNQGELPYGLAQNQSLGQYESHLWTLNTQVGDEIELSVTGLNEDTTLIAELSGETTRLSFFDTYRFTASGAQYEIEVLSRYGAGNYTITAVLLNPPTPTATLVPTRVPTLVPTIADEPILGIGDVQITLRWRGDGDLDLHVIDPSGEEIYYANRESSTNGQLDVDIIACSSSSPNVENIFWPEGQSPSGRYEVFVHYHPSCGDEGNQSYDVTISIAGQEPQVFSGTARNVGGRIDILTFNK